MLLVDVCSACVEAELQISAAFIPGRIAETHVGQVAKRICSAVGSISKKSGLVSAPVAKLTAELGETWWQCCAFGLVWSSVLKFEI